MSLVALANHVASRGRGDDKMLVHMTPGEVQGLQALALAHGGSLTINPETGLVEAGWLKSLLPAIAGFALNFIAPGVGTAIGGALGLGGAAGTAIAVGGLTGLATGSLKQGIMAGLGAYGGASLAGGLEAAGSAAAGLPGAETITGSAAAQQQLAAANELAMASAGQPLTTAESQRLLYSTLSPAEKAMSGFSALGTEAGRTAALQGVGGASGLMKMGLAAAAPLIADQMVPTATKVPPLLSQYPQRIRPMAFNQYGQTLQQLPMMSATPGTGTGMASGGAVALAAGGPPSGAMSPEDFKKMIYEGGANDAVATQRGIDYIMSKPGFNPTTATNYWNQALGTNFTEGDYFRVMKELGKDPYYYDKKAPETTGPVTGGTVTGGTVTGGTVTSGTSTTVGGGQPIVVSPVAGGTVPGYTGETKTYGPGQTAGPGTVVRNTPTIEDVRKAYTGTVEMPKLQDFKPVNTGSSKAAYDYLMGQGPYPLNPVLPPGTPIMKPYAESVGMVPPGFYGRQGTFDATGGFTPTPRVAPGAGGTEQAGGGVGGNVTNNAGVSLPADMVTWVHSATGTTELGSRDAHANDPEWTIQESFRRKDPNADIVPFNHGGITALAEGGYHLGGYSDGGRLLRGPGDGVSDSIPATIGNRQPARLADGEFVIPARIVSELGNGSTEAGARKLYAMMDRVQRARAKTTGKGKVATNTRAEKHLPA